MSEVVYRDLNDKVILVTGATRGIGKKIACSLAEQGAHVVFNYRGDDAAANALKDELTSIGGKASALKFDVTDTETMKSAIKDFTAEHQITGLVNNAGISKDQLILRLKEEDLQQIIGTNLNAAIMLTSILSRNFLKAKDVSVINVSSVVGLMGNASQVPYAASKAGLIGFTKSYAKELASRNVRCNAICPGFIETDMTQSLDDKVIESYKSVIPLSRMGSGEDVAALCMFLLSKASSYITGEVIKIDGGLYI
ncbi:MAG: 3-oxoacyl-ACP reductase FabG [Bacteriovoracaceae bacterium]|jgi:3-oxoacyl-[acyl-carrier protein] reductase|nr:3-oxoacyl-ACP reductase FabG [Bacteriovoracaceae bacterium]